jgi:hypothetical protein
VAVTGERLHAGGFASEPHWEVESAPIKNASGDDGPASIHQIQSNRHGAWLEKFDVRVRLRRTTASARALVAAPARMPARLAQRVPKPSRLIP